MIASLHWPIFIAGKYVYVAPDIIHTAQARRGAQYGWHGATINMLMTHFIKSLYVNP